jgi:hypothetical protein
MKDGGRVRYRTWKAESSRAMVGYDSYKDVVRGA